MVDAHYKYYRSELVRCFDIRLIYQSRFLNHKIHATSLPQLEAKMHSWIRY